MLIQYYCRIQIMEHQHVYCICSAKNIAVIISLIHDNFFSVDTQVIAFFTMLYNTMPTTLSIVQHSLLIVMKYTVHINYIKGRYYLS